MNRWLRARKWWVLASVTIAIIVAVILLPLNFLDHYVGQDFLIPLVFWAAVAFMLFYTLLSRWWHNPMGRMLVALDFSIALLTLPEVLISEFGFRVDSEATVRILAASLTIIAVTILSRFWLLGRLHHWKIQLPWRHKHDASQ